MSQYRMKRTIEEIWHTEAGSRDEAIRNFEDHPTGYDHTLIKSETIVKVKAEKAGDSA